jgi:hypothetical protein
VAALEQLSELPAHAYLTAKANAYVDRVGPSIRVFR